jgi:acetolactate synthase II small subunit
MSVHFEIRLAHNEGALLRTLGLIQRRGFNVGELALRSEKTAQLLSLSLDGQGRCPDVLARQIARLHDVETVERVEAEAWQTTVVDCVRALTGLLPGAETYRPATTEMRG